MQNPRVSVIITSLNGGKTIARAVHSVQRQTFQEWELVIFDDGSAQPLAPSIPHDERIHLVRAETSIGRQGALNAACAVAVGDYLAIIDDDDEWIDFTKLAQQVQFLDSHPDVGVVGTWANVVGLDGRHLVTLRPATRDAAIRHRMLSVNQFVNSSTMFRRQDFEDVGRYQYPLPLPANEDFDLWLRIGQRSKFANLPAVMVAWQKGGRSYSAGKRRHQLIVHFELIAKYGGGYTFLDRVRAYCVTAVRYVRYATVKLREGSHT